MVKGGLASMVAIAVTAWMARPAAACSCAPPPPVDQALSAAAVVFQGVAMRAEPSPKAITDPIDLGAATRVWFDVSKRWKGDATASLAILTPSSCAACGRDYTIGVAYVVYAARQRDGALVDVLCSRTRPADDAAEDLAALGPAMDPLPTPPPGPSAGGCSLARGRAPLVVTVLSAAALVALTRRRRAR